MNINEVNNKHNKILKHLENLQLKDAFDAIRQIADEQQTWAISEKLNDLETNYKYMIHYLVEGNKDSEQQKIYSQIVRTTYTLADDAIDQILARQSPNLFYEKMRVLNIRETLSATEYREAIIKYADTSSIIDLLPEGDDKTARRRQNRHDAEQIVSDLFYSLFSSHRYNNDEIRTLRELTNDEHISADAKRMIISALMLNVLNRFDSKKTEFLLEMCNHHHLQVSTPAIAAIVPIFQKYHTRLQHYPECTDRLKVMSDNPVFNRRFMTAIIQYIQAHETEKITKKLTEEIIPEMMKLSPIIGKKINPEEWMSESGFEDKNPAWQKIIEESGLQDKLQEFSELQLGGADVFHSTFSNLKNYPFFNEMSNWFLPFDGNHSQIRQFFGEETSNSRFLNIMNASSMMCDSDKYSFCFSLMTMPKQYRDMIGEHLNAESAELKNMEKEEAITSPFQEEEAAFKRYTQDLYRFYKLFSRKTDFEDIFMFPLNYHHIKWFEPIISSKRNLERIALYYFDKNNFKEASEVFRKLADQGISNGEIWQKIGYCLQMTGNLNAAIKAYLKAELMDDSNTWLLKRIAHGYRILKDPENALAYYRRLQQLKPTDLNIQLNIGHCYLELKRYDEALNNYFKVELIDNNNQKAWRSIAWVAFLSRKWDIAQSYYALIIQNKPSAHDFLNAGHVEFCLGNLKPATDFYRKSVEISGSYSAFKALLNEDLEELTEAGADIRLLRIVLDKVKYDSENQ